MEMWEMKLHFRYIFDHPENDLTNDVKMPWHLKYKWKTNFTE